MKASSAYYRLAIVLIAVLLRHSAVSQDLVWNGGIHPLKFNTGDSTKIKHGGGEYWKNLLIGISGISLGGGILIGTGALMAVSDDQSDTNNPLAIAGVTVGVLVFVGGWVYLFEPAFGKRKLKKKEQEELQHLALVSSYEKELKKAKTNNSTRIAERITGYWVLADRNDTASESFPDSCIFFVGRNNDSSAVSSNIYSVDGNSLYSATDFHDEADSLTFNFIADGKSHRIKIQHVYKEGLILTWIGRGDYFFKKFSGKELQKFIADKEMLHKEDDP